MFNKYVKENFDEYNKSIMKSLIFRKLNTKPNINSINLITGTSFGNYIQLDKFFLYGKRLVVELPVSFKIIDYLMENITGSYEPRIKTCLEFRSFLILAKNMELEESRWTVQRGLEELMQKNIISMIRSERVYKIKLNFFPDTWNVKEDWMIKIQNKIERRIFK
jgi:hypothetical protein